MKYSIGKTSESDSTQIKTKISILQDMEVGDWGWDICGVISFCLIESIWVRVQILIRKVCCAGDREVR